MRLVGLGEKKVVKRCTADALSELGEEHIHEDIA